VKRDAAKLALVGAAGFLESFADDHGGDDLVAHIRDTHSEAWYAERLADPAHALWIAEAPLGAPVGYAILGPAALPGAAEGDAELKRIYFLAPWQGSGLGKGLLEAVLAEARAWMARRVLLAVYSRNVRAQAFYRRAGFEVIGGVVFHVGPTAFDDLVMALTLSRLRDCCVSRRRGVY
jgi:diamine N-acetyltransferase